MKLLELIVHEILTNKSFFSFGEKLNQHTYKRFSELCIFFRLSSQAASKQNEAAVLNLQTFLLQEINKLSPDDVFKNFYISYHIILPYVSLRQFEKCEALEKCLHLINERTLFSPEIPPHRQMEWAYMQYLQGRQATVPIPANAILAQDAYLQYFDRDLTYAFTHGLFYATDFGFMNSPPPVKDSKKLAFQLECLMARFYEEGDVDLVLELAISYFALLPHTPINLGMLEIVDSCLAKTAFIEFNCTEETLEKKYHSLFVLGIFCSLLQTLIHNTSLPATVKSALQKAVSQAGFLQMPGGNNTITISTENAGAALLAWQIIKQLTTKEFDKALYQNYVERYGRNPYLADEVIAYLSILQYRSRNNILWNREFEYLQVSEDKRAALNTASTIQLEEDIAYCKNEMSSVTLIL